FCWDLFTTWLTEDGKTKTDWAMMSLAHFGGDEAVRRITPLIRSWPGEAAHARAARGLELLAVVGSDVALMSLYGISQKVKYKKLQEKARDMVDHIARSLDLSPHQLADRLVPDLGLEENGSKVLDFGPRKFIIGFDEQLKPFIKDENGKPIKNLPKPGKIDDEEKAAQAVTTWKALKKDARAIASTQIQRLEQAMCNSRRWTVDVFMDFLVNHP
ncbi:MAG: DUF4132 domain-containing protein, partial [bacterium]|nr:DUF4132 domain-containing protein [bacterium]